MSYTKRFGIITVVFMFFFGITAMNAAAQTRRVVRVHRPVHVHRYWGYDPFWNWNYDPYMYDPYLNMHREKYYKEKAVRDASRKLEKDRAKYQADGVLTPKEQEKLIKKRRDYEKAVAKLNKFNRERY